VRSHLLRSSLARLSFELNLTLQLSSSTTAHSAFTDLRLSNSVSGASYVADLDAILNTSLIRPFLIQYWFWAGLAGTGLWVVAHECGHQGFSESKTINNAVGWALHSALGVPYHSWRVSHGRHHAATGHIARDEVFVPRTREQLVRFLPLLTTLTFADAPLLASTLQGYPKRDEEREDLEGLSVTEERQHELREAIGDAPLYVLVNLISQQLVGFQMYVRASACPRFIQEQA
jgi:hypothetical protein